MSGQALRVFLSHTGEFRDHPTPRSFVAAAKEAVARAGCAPVDMDYFAAGCHTPAVVCHRKVVESDVYVGIVGLRYGSPVRDKPEVSYTELEFTVAGEAAKPRLIFMLDEESGSPLPAKYLYDHAFGARQRAFRERLRDSGLLVRTFATPDDLHLEIYHALTEQKSRPPEPYQERLVQVILHSGEQGRAAELSPLLLEHGFRIITRDDWAAASQVPVIVCASYRAVATEWLPRLLDRIPDAAADRSVILAIDEGLRLPTVLPVVSGYWQDAAGAAAALAPVLRSFYPHDAGLSAAAPDLVGSGGDDVDFLDVGTPVRTYNSQLVEEFREAMRVDVVEELPATMSTGDFLINAGLMRGGSLTRAGLLLFGARPSGTLPWAIVQCVRYRGTTKAATRERVDLSGTVPAQIAGAWQFVADRTLVGAAPSVSGATAEPVYSYPMIAVREMIANAVAHRDYSCTTGCVHIRLFDDRLEISSPGAWLGQAWDDDRQRAIGDLAGESRRRNFRLASILTWISVFEGEGSGIPSSVADCRRSAAPQPSVVEHGDFVTVTIWPRQDRTRSARIAPLVAELEQVFDDAAGARMLLADIGYPADQIPTTMSSAFWRDVVAQLERGLLPDGSIELLALAALRRYMGNVVFRAVALDGVQQQAGDATRHITASETAAHTGDARAALRSAWGIRQRLVEAEPSATNRRDLIDTHLRLGDVDLARRDFIGALLAYGCVVCLLDELAESAPRDTAIQCDLAHAYLRIAGVYLEEGDLLAADSALNLALVTLHRDTECPDDVLRLTLLDGVLTRIGDVAASGRHLAVALGAYEQSLAVIRRLFPSDRLLSGRLRLVAALERVGDVAVRMGRSVHAGQCFTEALVILEGIDGFDQRLGELRAKYDTVEFCELDPPEDSFGWLASAEVDDETLDDEADRALIGPAPR